MVICPIAGELELPITAVDFLSPKSSLSRVASGFCSPPSSCTSSGVVSSDAYPVEIASSPNEDEHKPCSQESQADELENCEAGGSTIDPKASALCSITLSRHRKEDNNSEGGSVTSNVSPCMHGPQEVDPAVWSDHYSQERGRCGRIGFTKASDDHHGTVEAPESSRMRSSSVPKGPKLQCSFDSRKYAEEFLVFGFALH